MKLKPLTNSKNNILKNKIDLSRNVNDRTELGHLAKFYIYDMLKIC
jgi:hypothetical protein